MVSEVFPSYNNQINKYKEPLLVNLNCPVDLVSYKIETSKNERNVFLRIKFINLSEKIISAIKIKFLCFDAFNEPVMENDSNVVIKTIQDINAKKRDIFNSDGLIELKGFEDTRKLRVIITSVLFADGNRWDYNSEDVFETVVDLVKDEELLNLIEVAGAGSICYAKVEPYYWQCVCGKANLNDQDNCVICKREKMFLINYCSSKDHVKGCLRITREEKRKKIEEQKELEKKRALQRALQVAQIKRKIIWVGIIIFVLVMGTVSYYYLNTPNIITGNDFNAELGIINQETNIFKADSNIQILILAKKPFGSGNSIKLRLVNANNNDIENEIASEVRNDIDDLWAITIPPLNKNGNFEVRFYINDVLRGKKTIQVFYEPIMINKITNKSFINKFIIINVNSKGISKFNIIPLIVGGIA